MVLFTYILACMEILSFIITYVKLIHTLNGSVELQARINPNSVPWREQSILALLSSDWLILLDYGGG